MRSRLLLAISLFLLPALVRGNEPTVTVMVTRPAPIESLSPTGDVLGVKEATVGTKFTLVSASGTQLILQDDQGAHYELAANATDYTAPSIAPTPGPAAVVSTAVQSPIPTPVPEFPKPAEAPSAPPPEISSAPPKDGDVFTVTMDDRDKDNVVAVYPQGGIAGRPLLMAAHGNGGSGPNEIKGWIALAKAHNFTVVCPTFQSSVSSSFMGSDTPYFRHILHWIEDNLQYDKDQVYMTGFSGGGCATWYFATQRPDFFHGLFLQSGNYWGPIDGFSLSGWFDRPIEVIWGSQDIPNIVTEGQAVLDALKDAGCTKVVHTVIQGAGHQEHPDLVVKWMEDQVANQASPSAN